MPDIRDFCERLWNGEIDTTFEAHPVTSSYNNRKAEEIHDGLLYYKGLAGVTTIDTGESLVMLDTGAQFDAQNIYDQVRAWRPDLPLAAATFSHHHIDHIFGVGLFEREATDKGRPRTIVYGHEAMPAHFDRYKKMPGWNGSLNARQFIQRTGPVGQRIPWPDEYRYPDVTFRDRVTFTEGGLTFELHHARGECEDSIWVWVPELKLLAPGDLFIWAVPNAGNPQKVQRWVGEWAVGLREMAALGAELMIPGHGFPVFGADRIAQACDDTAALLESIEEQTIALMNTGASLDTVLHSVEIPQDAVEKPYLRPVYDHPQFLIRNVWRLNGGWYDGEPDHLLPAPRAEIAREWVDLAGGPDNVLERAKKLLADGNLRLACHVIEYAAHAAPDSEAVHDLRAEIYDARAKEQTSSMSRGVFMYASSSSKELRKRDAFQAG